MSIFKKDIFGETRGAARTMLILLTLRIVLVCLTVPLIILAGKGTPMIEWITIILSVIWSFSISIATIVLIIKRHIAGKILGWIVAVDVLIGGILAIFMGQLNAFASVLTALCFTYYIVKGLLSQDLRDYYAATGKPKNYGFPVEQIKS